MSELNNKRRHIKGQLTRLYNYFQDLTLEDAVLEDVEERYLNDQEVQEQEQQAIEVERKYFETRALAKHFVTELTKVGNKSGVAPTNSDETISDVNINTAVQTLMQHQTSLAELVKQGSSQSNPLDLQNLLLLPKLDIPTFNGNFKDWPEFFDTFQKLIHENKKYSDAMKLQYLKRSLVGKAKDIFKNLPATDANYMQAYAELVETYDKSDLIVNSYLEIILGQRKLMSTSADGLRILCNEITESVRALTALKQPTNHWDTFLVYIVSSKLDDETLTLWHREQIRQEMSYSTLKFTDIITFIRNRIYELSNLKTSSTKCKETKVRPRVMHATTSSNSTSDIKCPLCCNLHLLHKCPEFLKMTINSRRNFVRQRQLCFNCLKNTHLSKGCPSKSCCRKCNTRHHTMVHSEDIVPNISSVAIAQPRLVTLLPTAVVLVKNASSQFVPCRILLDTGSQISLISQDCLQYLRLKTKFEKHLVQGISSSKPCLTKGTVSLTIRSRLTNFEITIQASVLSKLTSALPSTDVQQVDHTILNNIELADPLFYKSSKIDIIASSDVFFQIIGDKRISCGPDNSYAVETKLGWLISGHFQEPNATRSQIYHTCIDVDQSLRLFWELENIQDQIQLSDEEQAAEEYFKQSHSRNIEGRYIVQLPFKRSNILLGNSRASAMKRFSYLEKRFKANPGLKEQYSKFIEEYIELGHMSLIPKSKENLADHECFYLPHHPVLKESSTTTKLRVVFDGSNKSSTGISLNDKLMIGSIDQADIWTLLMKFRRYKFAYTADIAKMYRQVLIHEDDSSFQRILWRESDKAPIREYELKTVTYGTASAPHSAIRVLNQLSLDEEHKYPVGAYNLRNYFYVDDFLGCTHTLQEALMIKSELTNLLAEGGFHLRKWSSNSSNFLDTVPEDNRETLCQLPGDQDGTIKTLGLKWSPCLDKFSFGVHIRQHSQLTKRKVLSEISQIFDPLGLIGPCTTLAKLYMQKIWISGVDWDSELPKCITEDYVKFRQSLTELSHLQIPRWTSITCSSVNQLIGFADASESAFAAVIYIRTVSQGRTYVRLLTSKSKVAPIRQVSLPRLELCAAYLLTKLMCKCRGILNIPNEQIIVYTDSTIVLGWLGDIPRKWKTFIGNRTSFILSNIPSHHWHHVKSASNPADAASRGLTANQIINYSLWWNGPDFLKSHDFDIHKLQRKHFSTQLEARKLVHLVNEINPNSFEQDLFNRYSKLNRLQRITAWCLRFVTNCKRKFNKQDPVADSHLTVEDLQLSLRNLIKISQTSTFSKEISLLHHKKFQHMGCLTSLNPFLDQYGILRVGGRIQESETGYNHKHPVLLSRHHMLSQLIVEDIHHRYLHAGQQLVLNVLNFKYWIIGARVLVKKSIRNCVTCIRYRACPANQLMGSLPSFRVIPARPFSNTGVDFAGPLFVRASRGRGSKVFKSYVSIFVCMVTRALHIELVSDLSSDAFLAALYRFISRRGTCDNIYCDNGRNFVGAARKLNEMQQLIIKNSDQIASKLGNKGIKFHFIPVSTPHFGGMWESSVKSMKTHLKRVIGESKLTFEEMSTLLCQIEACLNTRPISSLTSDVNDQEALTPAHFLTFGPLEFPHQESLIESSMSYLSRWQLVQCILQHFWKRWKSEYLSTLQKRKKWQYPNKNLKVNDLVIVKDDNLPPGQWFLGKVISTTPGKDSLVRVVTLKTKVGIMDRPIHKLCILLQPNNVDNVACQAGRHVSDSFNAKNVTPV